ncbi:VOC family protein [Oscillatoriales cyanobacterium LEGE 11467]|uniref:VOC family protein n=1 Tax=Zarconia navalis LEGE 11467 TaxID=1828826 RepID=A0A928ZA00_9CYAN|nr:VOC family protein [Zarconia navalis]MBE9042294.1 VOC family protein [Zarconia navalis LEGE 11467]
MKFEYTYTRLNVADYEACKQFYSQVLGFEIAFVDDNDRYVELTTGDTRITLFDRKNLKEFVGQKETLTYDRHYAGIALSFQVANLEEAIAHLQSNGITLVNQPWDFPDRGFISACFRDPDGNLIELQQLLLDTING